MSELSAAIAKLAGNLKAVQRVLQESARYARPISAFEPAEVQHYFINVHAQLATLRTQRPDLYADFADFPTEPDKAMAMPDGKPQKFFSRDQLERLTRDIEQIFEIRSNSELVTPAAANAAEKRRVFVSHGRANDWREVQQYIEKDIGFETRELAQEPNLGRTILAKLNETANECDSAVIVMTGDDLDAAGLSRARENV